MNTDHNIAFFVVTEDGKQIAKILREKLRRGTIYTTPQLYEEGTYAIRPSLSVVTGEVFKTYDTLVFIMAAGIAVRMIAPYVQDKLKDPAVLVIDDLGRHVISLLSGHMGGGNQMTLEISEILKAHPVITTSTDVHHKAALDTMAKALDGYIDHFREQVRAVNYLLIHNKKVGFYKEDCYEVQDLRGFTPLKDLNNLEAFKKVVCVTYKDKLEADMDVVVKVVPKDLVIGIGCRKETPIKLLEDSLKNFLESYNIDSHAVKCLASVEVKKDEKAIIALAGKLGVPFEVIETKEIAKVENLFEKSEFVKSQIGVYSVAEPAAYLVSNGNLWIGKHKYKGITFAIGRIKK